MRVADLAARMRARLWFRTLEIRIGTLSDFTTRRAPPMEVK